MGSLLIVIALLSAAQPVRATEVDPSVLDSFDALRQAVDKGTTPRACVQPPLSEADSGDPNNASNLALHACPKKPRTENPYLPDLFAAECSCPTPEKSLSATRSAMDTARDRVVDSRSKTVERLKENPVVASEFKRQVAAACSRCAAQFGTTASALSDCLGRGVGDGMAATESGAMFVIDADYVQRHVRGLKGYVPNGDQILTGPFATGAIDPALSQDGCEKLNIYSSGGFAGSLLSDHTIDVLRKPGDLTPVPKDLSRREVSPELFAAVDAESLRIREEAYPASQTGKAEEMFADVKARARAWLAAQVAQGAPKSDDCKNMPPSIDSIDCYSRAEGADNVMAFAMNQIDSLSLEIPSKLSDVEAMNADFDGDHSVHYGSPFLALVSKDPENVRKVFSHEIGHSVFKVLSRLADTEKLPLVRCLRGTASVGAKSNPDQIGETFADWFSVELQARRHEKDKNARRAFLEMDKNLCEAGPTEGSADAASDPHPESPARINRLTAANPTVRRALGAGPDATDPAYCKPPEGLGINFRYYEKGM